MDRALYHVRALTRRKEEGCTTLTVLLVALVLLVACACQTDGRDSETIHVNGSPLTKRGNVQRRISVHPPRGRHVQIFVFNFRFQFSFSVFVFNFRFQFSHFFLLARKQEEKKEIRGQ